MKVYITRYALTKGIIECEGEVNSEQPNMFKGKGYNYYHKPDWHENKEQAILRANEMVKKKVKQIKAQLIKLEKLKF